MTKKKNHMITWSYTGWVLLLVDKVLTSDSITSYFLLRCWFLLTYSPLDRLQFWPFVHWSTLSELKTHIFFFAFSTELCSDNQLLWNIGHKLHSVTQWPDASVSPFWISNTNSRGEKCPLWLDNSSLWERMNVGVSWGRLSSWTDGVCRWVRKYSQMVEGNTDDIFLISVGGVVSDRVFYMERKCLYFCTIERKHVLCFSEGSGYQLI